MATAESDRGCILIAADIVANMLKDLLKAKFTHESKIHGLDAESLFEGESAPLGSLFHRANIAWALGLIDDRLWRGSFVLRKIGNRFAHSNESISISDAGVSWLYKAIGAATAERHEFAFVSSFVMHNEAAMRNVDISAERMKFSGLLRILILDLTAAIQLIKTPEAL